MQQGVDAQMRASRAADPPHWRAQSQGHLHCVPLPTTAPLADGRRFGCRSSTTLLSRTRPVWSMLSVRSVSEYYDSAINNIIVYRPIAGKQVAAGPAEAAEALDDYQLFCERRTFSRHPDAPTRTAPLVLGWPAGGRADQVAQTILWTIVLYVAPPRCPLCPATLPARSSLV